ncbi:MAG: hypothetical protein HY812_04890 [Planctomycetes bacterium]|nr:hypothetical protein [Planctomycetota bacterium]
MKLFRPSTVLCVALVLVAALQANIALEFDRSARRQSHRGDEAGFPLDDAWIHQVYARSVAERFALEYNPGEPEAGQSSMLWGLLLAPVHWAAAATGTPVGSATRLFGAALWILVALAAALFVAALPVPGARFGGFAAALLVALDPAAAFAAASGMEPLLLALFALLGFFGLQSGRFLLAGISAGLGILARPEGVILAALLAGGALLAGLRRPPPGGTRSLAPLIKTAAPAVLCALAWVFFCLAVTGRPFPNTFYVKAAAAEPLAALADGAALLARVLAASPFYEGYAGYLFLAIGAIALLARCDAARALLLLAAPAAYLAGVAATRSLPEPDAFYWERYLIPIVPLLDAVTAVGFAALGAVLHDALRGPAGAPRAAPQDGEEAGPPEEAARAGEADPRAEPFPLPQPAVQPFLIPNVVLAVFLALCGVVPFLATPRRLQQRIDEFGRNVSDVDRMNVEAALWLADQTRLPRAAVVATQDAGAVRYFARSDCVLDLLGLNDHRLVASGLSGAGVRRYLDERAPRVFVLLEPDHGALDFRLYAAALGLKEVRRFAVEEYSLFGTPASRAVVILADLPP